MDEAVVPHGAAIISDFTGTHMDMDTSKDEDLHSDDSQETNISSTSQKSIMMARIESDTSDAETDSENGETETQAATNIKKRKYPYWPLFFIMAATIGQRQATTISLFISVYRSC